MKLILILAAVILTVHSLSAGERWLNFKQKFLKSYESNIEENRRFTIFRSNLKRIEEHNAKYENGEVSYYMGITQFADMTAEEFQDMLNIQLRNRPNIQRNYADFSSVEVPDSIDWQNKGAVLSVKDQGSCGSCWAFSATGALEGQNFLVNNISTTLSEQELLDCTIIYDNYACSGGLMQHAFQYVRDKGLSSEESYPYVAYQRRCERSSTQRIVNISDYQIVSQEDLKNAVGSIGPISVAITATTSLSLYEGGIFDDPDCPFNATMLNHGVLVVGYGTEDGQDFWRIKNSWGSSWGDNGFFKIRRNPNICGLGLDNSYPIVVPNDTF